MRLQQEANQKIEELAEKAHTEAIKYVMFIKYVMMSVNAEIVYEHVVLGVGSWTSNFTNAGSIPGDVEYTS